MSGYENKLDNYFSEDQEEKGAYLMINVLYAVLPGSPKLQLCIGPWITACHN